MSYCVNCGVELDKTAGACPLCNTPVLNPRQPVDVAAEPPFPVEKGQVETVKRRDLAILLSALLLAAMVTCLLLNLFVFRSNLWSLAVIGGSVVAWVFYVPLLMGLGKIPCLTVLVDGMSVAVCLYLLTFLKGSDRWFLGVGLPIVLWLTVLAEVSVFVLQKWVKAFLTKALYLITAIGVTCGGLEILIDRYVNGEVSLRWSAVVLTVCGTIDIVLITTLSLKRLRAAVRRRLHF